MGVASQMERKPRTRCPPKTLRRFSCWKQRSYDWRSGWDSNLTGAIVFPKHYREGSFKAYLARLINCAVRSAMTMIGAFVLPLVMVGMIEPSATRRFVQP